MQLYSNLVWGGSISRVAKAGSFAAFSQANILKHTIKLLKLIILLVLMNKL